MARTVQVILTRRIDGLGEAGTEHSVSFAYAQRVLLPGGSAEVANSRTRSRILAQFERSQRAQAQQAAAAERTLAALKGKTVLVTARASGTKLYGSVDAAAIAAAIRTRLGVTLDPSWIRIAAPIVTVGDHRVVVEAPGATRSNLTVTVSATERA